MLKDKECLHRCTQLKRSVYRIMEGLDDRKGEEPAQETDHNQDETPEEYII